MDCAHTNVMDFTGRQWGPRTTANDLWRWCRDCGALNTGSNWALPYPTRKVDDSTLLISKERYEEFARRENLAFEYANRLTGALSWGTFDRQAWLDRFMGRHVERKNHPNDSAYCPPDHEHPHTHSELSRVNAQLQANITEIKVRLSALEHSHSEHEHGTPR